MKFSEFVYLVKDYGCANFRNQQSFLTRFSQITIFLYSGRWKKKKTKKKKKKKKKKKTGCIWVLALY